LKQYVTRKHKFDAGHRVMHERFKCHNMHGHEYHVEITLSYEQPKSLGYAIDFKEIKRVGCSWIDDFLDHAFICNPQDKIVIDACKAVGSKYYLMNLVDKEGFCNPSAENIAKELFFILGVLLNRGDETALTVSSIKLHETTNCYVECTGLTEAEENQLLLTTLFAQLFIYKMNKGSVEYDQRINQEVPLERIEN